MKRKSILVALMVLVLALSSQLSIFALSAQAASLSPSLISSGYSVSKKTVSAGDTFNLNFTLKNTSSEIDIRNLNIRLSGGEVFAVNNDTDTIYSSKIAKGEKASFSKSFYCSTAAADGVYPIALTASYEYFENGEKVAATSEINYSVKVSGSKSSAAPLTPQLIVSDFSYGGDSVSAMQKFDLSFNLKNTSKDTEVKNVIVKLSGGEAYVISQGTDTIPVNSIKANSSVNLTKSFEASVGVLSGVYPVTASVSYEYYQNGEKLEGSTELSMSIPLIQQDRIDFGTVELSGATVTVGQETDCAFTIINSGKTEAANAVVKLLDNNDKQLSSAYIGNIAAGEQFASNYTLPVTFETKGEAKLKLVIEYENERMEKKSVSHEFTLTVEEKYDPYQEMMDNTQVPVEDGPNYTVIIIVAVVVIVVLVVAVVVGVKVRKKKKAGKGSDEFDEEI